MAEEFVSCSAGIIGLFFVAFCPIDGLQLSMGKLEVSSVRRLFCVQVSEARKSVPIKLLTAIFCSELSSVKCCAQTRECFEGVKQFYRMFYEYEMKDKKLWF